MKKIILSAVIAIFAITVTFGQSLSINRRNVWVNGPSTTAFAHYDTITIKNISGSDKVIRVQRYVQTFLGGSENYFCWGATCYPPNANISNSPIDIVTITPGDTNNTFKGYLDPVNNVGTCIIKYCFFDVTNQADSVCFTATYNAGVVSTEETTVKVSNPYPNPSSDNVNFTYNISNINKASLKVYNMLGALVKTVNITDNTGKLAVNTSDLRPGLYLYDLQVNGKSYKTGKFTVIQ